MILWLQFRKETEMELNMEPIGTELLRVAETYDQIDVLPDSYRDQILEMPKTFQAELETIEKLARALNSEISELEYPIEIGAIDTENEMIFYLYEMFTDSRYKLLFSILSNLETKIAELNEIIPEPEIPDTECYGTAECSCFSYGNYGSEYDRITELYEKLNRMEK